MFGIKLSGKNGTFLLSIFDGGWLIFVPFLGRLAPRSAYEIVKYHDVSKKNKSIILLPLGILVGKILVDIKTPIINLSTIEALVIYFLLVVFICLWLFVLDKHKIKKNTHAVEVDLNKKYFAKIHLTSLRNLILVCLLSLFQLGVFYLGATALKTISLTSVIVTLFSGFLFCLIPSLIDALYIVEIDGEIYSFKS